MDEAAKAEVADDSPAEFDDLAFGEVFAKLVEEFLVDVVVVDEEAFRVVKGGHLGGRKAGIAPGADPGDGFLFEGISFP